ARRVRRAPGAQLPRRARARHGRRARQPAFRRDADPRADLAMTGDRPNVERGSAPTPNPTDRPNVERGSALTPNPTDRPNVERGSAPTPNPTDYTKPLPEISAESKPFWDACARHEL